VSLSEGHLSLVLSNIEMRLGQAFLFAKALLMVEHTVLASFMDGLPWLLEL
jgi:hypothetical protein